MKIAILSRNSKSYSTKRLKEAAKNRGHQIRVLDTLEFGILIEQNTPDMTYCSKLLSAYDAVIPRIGASVTFYGASVVRQFEQMGVYSLNQSASILVSRDKLRALQVLSRHGVGMPETAFVISRNDIIPAIERMGGAPVIIKLLEGTQGIGVILAETLKAAEAIVETFQSTKQQVLIQKFVKESKGKDIRAFVVGDQVVAAVRRSAVGDEFRSNVHRGGNAKIVKLEHCYEQTAVKAAQVLGLRVAGVDILESADGPQVLEVNSSPGLEGIEKATGIDIASAIIEYLEEQFVFQDFDIHQKLALAKGYTVAEFMAGEGLDGLTLEESGLREMDILVLSINRNGQIIPAPQDERELIKGDVLLCFGNRRTLKEWLPSLNSRKRRTRKKNGEIKNP